MHGVGHRATPHTSYFFRVNIINAFEFAGNLERNGRQNQMEGDPVAIDANISQTVSSRLQLMQVAEWASVAPIIRRLLLALFKGQADEEIITTVMQSYIRSNTK